MSKYEGSILTKIVFLILSLIGIAMAFFVMLDIKAVDHGELSKTESIGKIMSIEYQEGTPVRVPLYHISYTKNTTDANLLKTDNIHLDNVILDDTVSNPEIVKGYLKWKGHTTTTKYLKINKKDYEILREKRKFP